MNTLIKIKRLLIASRVKFTDKAINEMARDRITPLLVVEAILNAQAISMRIASHNPKTRQREYLYIISGQTFSGLII